MKHSIKITVFFSCLLFVSASPFLKAEPTPWRLDEQYQGPHTDHYNRLRYEVPILVRQTMVDLSARVGLDFQEGFEIPLIIKFVDGLPGGTENVLAFVGMGNDNGHPVQILGINLDAYARDSYNFEKVFAHELVHAMLNDGVGGVYLPAWIHEGLAVYGANQGEQMIRFYMGQNPSIKPEQFINGLDSGYHSAYDYMEDYLAFKFIYDRYGLNALRRFTRVLIDQRGNWRLAVEDATGQTWDHFQRVVRDYSIEQLREMGRDNRRPPERPF